MRLTLALAGLAVLAAGCGAGTGELPDEPAAGRPSPPPPASSAPLRYEATATVLEQPGRGPMLCLGAMLMSLPPQCGDIPLAGWSWDAVEGAQEHSGVRWGEFHVVGTYDGETFTVEEAGPPEPAPAEPVEDMFLPPCPEPEGGWLAGASSAPSQEDTDAAERYAQRQPDYVRSWVHHVGDPAGPDEYEEELPVVYVAVFTGDAARHEPELRARWQGPLCVVERAVVSARDGRRIRAEAEASLPELGLQMLASWEGELGLAAEIEVVADPGGAGQAALDDRFGPGVVRLVPRLRPAG